MTKYLIVWFPSVEKIADNGKKYREYLPMQFRHCNEIQAIQDSDFTWQFVQETGKLVKQVN